MNLLSFSLNHCENTIFARFHYDYSIYFGNSLLVHYLFCEFPLNSQSASRFYYEFTVVFAKSLLNRYLYREFTIHKKSFSWIRIESTFFPRIISEFNIYFANPIWIELQSTILFAESRSIHYPLHFITVNTLLCEYTYYVFTISSANSPWINHLFRKFTMKHYLFRKFTINTISVSQIYNLLREMTKNSLCIHYLLWVHFLFREFTIFFANSQWIHYLYPEFIILFSKSR